MPAPISLPFGKPSGHRLPSNHHRTGQCPTPDRHPLLASRLHLCLAVLFVALMWLGDAFGGAAMVSAGRDLSGPAIDEVSKVRAGAARVSARILVSADRLVQARDWDGPVDVLPAPEHAFVSLSASASAPAPLGVQPHDRGSLGNYRARAPPGLAQA